MKRILRSFLNWLDRKFPDKVEVTKDIYDLLFITINTQENRIRKLEEELIVLKTQMTNVNLAIGFSAPKLGVLER